MLAQNIQWHQETDVVVVGYGCAGAVAALTAHDNGARVLVLEKQPEDTHISFTYMSGGTVICPTDEAKTVAYMEAISHVGGGVYWTDPAITRIWAKYAMENRLWLENIGAKLKLLIHGGEQKASGMEAIDAIQIRGMGSRLMTLLGNQLKARQIPTVYDTAASELFTNAAGEIIGVKTVTSSGKFVNVRANRAVILCCGGFEFNEEMKLQFLRVYPTYFTGSPANTGDGIRMAQAVGAQIWHMNCCSASLIMKFPEYPFAFGCRFTGKVWIMPGETPVETSAKPDRPAIPGYIIVDRHGRRFTNENIKMHAAYYETVYFDTHKMEFPRVPSYWIFDRRRMEDSALAWKMGPTAAARYYKWSEDNSLELKKGWIIQGDTLPELAAKLDMEYNSLERTFQVYNGYCRAGYDPEFHRAPNTMFPLETPPYYAVALWPGGWNTQGGPRRDAEARIIGAGGHPIRCLYSAGELGSIYGMLYPQAGGNLAECIVFGRIAGQNAAKETFK